jgi:hypothetical protein
MLELQKNLGSVVTKRLYPLNRLMVPKEVKARVSPSLMRVRMTKVILLGGY